MLTIRIVTQHSALGWCVADSLQKSGNRVQGLCSDKVDRPRIRYRTGLELDQVRAVAQQLNPLVITDFELADLEAGVDVQIELGDRKEVSSWTVTVFSDSLDHGRNVAQQLHQMGFDVKRLQLQPICESSIQYGGASEFACQLADFALSRLSQHLPTVKSWGEDDDDLWIHAPDPSVASLSPQQRTHVVLMTDEPQAVTSLIDDLRADGFRVLGPQPLPPASKTGYRFAVDYGSLRHLNPLADEIEKHTRSFANALQLDDRLFPFKLDDAGCEQADDETRGTPWHEPRLPMAIGIYLPIGAWRRGELAPYDGGVPERFDVVIRTDEPKRLEPLAKALTDAGCRGVRFADLEADTIGNSLRIGAEQPCATAAENWLVPLLMTQFSLLKMADLRVPLPVPSDRTAFSRIELTLRLGSVPDELRTQRLRAAMASHHIIAFARKTDRLEALETKFRAMGLAHVKVSARPRLHEFKIIYGGAPPELLEALSDELRELAGSRPELEQEWPATDHDIYVSLPDRIADTIRGRLGSLVAAQPSLVQSITPSPTPRSDSRPLLMIDSNSVRLGALVLDRREGTHVLAPRPEAFRSYCVDQRTAETLVHLGRSVLLNEPCLLDGPTCTSKTSSVQFLASLLNQPVVRVNLHGQTDASELVGRYLPATSGESQAMWRWQDGPVVQAMLQGWWLILDELNLAEPAVLERLNSLLEPEPSLLLTEHDSRLLGPGGTPIHPSFRIFATMNPVEYVGRSPLSPAYRDRWQGYRQVQVPAESEYLTMLRFWTLGENPCVCVEGVLYAPAPCQPATFPLIGVLPNAPEKLAALAKFHSALHRAAGADKERTLGQGRREPYVFSRRTLLAMLTYVERELAHNPQAEIVWGCALERYYLGRCRDESDRTVMHRLLEASGLAASTERKGPANEPDSASAPDSDDEDDDGAELLRELFDSTEAAAE